MLMKTWIHSNSFTAIIKKERSMACVKDNVHVGR